MTGRKLPYGLRVRYMTSAISAWIMNLGMFGITLRGLCSPAMNCHGCPWAAFGCPVGVAAYGAAMRTFPVLAVSTVLAVGVVLGRLVCSFICPFGLLQDLLFKIPIRKIRLPRATRYIKYAALALLVVIFPLALGFERTAYLMVEQQSAEMAGVGAARGELQPGIDLEAFLDDLASREEPLLSANVEVMVKNIGTGPIESVALDVFYEDMVTGEEIYREARTFADVTVAPGQSVQLPTFQVPYKLDVADIRVEVKQDPLTIAPRYGLYYCKVCPVGTLEATVPAYAAAEDTNPGGILSGSYVRIGILVFFLVLMLLVSRPFCRTFCPLGAFYGIISRLALSRITVDKDKCTECGLCNKPCPVDLDVVNEAGGAECIACGECITACPQSAIRRKFGL